MVEWITNNWAFPIYLGIFALIVGVGFVVPIRLQKRAIRLQQHNMERALQSGEESRLLARETIAELREIKQILKDKN